MFQSGQSKLRFVMYILCDGLVDVGDEVKEKLSKRAHIHRMRGCDFNIAFLKSEPHKSSHDNLNVAMMNSFVDDGTDFFYLYFQTKEWSTRNEEV